MRDKNDGGEKKKETDSVKRRTKQRGPGKICEEDANEEKGKFPQ